MCRASVPTTLRAATFYTLLCILAYANSSSLSSPLWNETWTDKLRRDLFSRYDKFSRPTEHYNTTTVTLEFYLTHLTIDEHDFTITVYGSTGLKWNDNKLKWSSSLYGGLDRVNVGIHEIWQPDVCIFNSAANSHGDFSDTLSVAQHDGSVAWVPFSKFKTFCDFDLRAWPFDTQTCSLHIGSCTYDDTRVNFTANINHTYPNDFLISNVQWELLNASVSREEDIYTCCSQTYPRVVLTFTLKRISGLYRSILVTSVIAIVSLILITFWLPCRSETRVILASCTMLLIAVYLIYFGFKIPETKYPPLIMYFYSGCLCQVTISLILSVLVINMSKKTFYKPLPRMIRMILLSRLGRLLGLKDLVKMIQSQKPVPSQELHGKLMDEAGVASATNSLHDSNNDCDQQNMIFPREDTSRLEWIMAATAIDRLAFFIFSFTFAVMGITYLT